MQPSSWFTAFRPYAVTIGAAPGPWTPDDPESALLTRTDAASRRLRRLTRIEPAQAPARVVVSLFDARSVMGQVVVHDTEPPTDTDRIEWDLIEQAPVEFGSGPCPLDVTRGEIDSDVAIDQILSGVAPGRHMVRVLCMGLHPDSYLTQIRIDIWPIDGHAEHEVLLRGPARYSPPEARAGRERDVAPLWPRLQTALRDAGVTSSPVFDLQPAAQAPLVNTGHPSLEPDPPRALDDLIWGSDWFAIVHAVPSGRLDGLIPGYDVLSLDQALATRAMMIEAWDIGEAGPYGNVAGSPAYTFIPEYLPIAEQDGYLLVMDLRPGALARMIRRFEKVDADDDTTWWLSVGDLLLDLTVAIETGTAFDGWLPGTQDGRLVWTLTT